MSDASVRVEWSELEREIQRIGGNVQQAGRFMPAVAELLVAAVHDVYDAEGPGWPSLAPRTLRQRRGSVAHILQDSGVMANSTAPQHGADFAEAVSNVPYTPFHVTGTRHMPKRNPFDLGPFENAVFEDAAAIILEGIAGG